MAKLDELDGLDELEDELEDDDVEIKERPIITKIAIALLIPFTFFLFGAIEWYLINIDDIWYGLKSIIPVILGATIVVFMILYVLCHILYKREKLFNYFSALLLGVGIALYVQGNVMNTKYGVMNGQSVDWSQYSHYGQIGIIIWVLCIISPFVLLLVIGEAKFKRAVKILSICLISIQIVILSFLLITRTGNIRDGFTITKEKMFDLNKDENFVILLIDAFDASIFDELNLQSDYYQNLFRDFTYFQNTVGAYTTTRGGVPYILTGSWNENTVNYSSYLENSYNKASFYDELLKNGFDIGIYTVPELLDGQMMDKKSVNFIDTPQKIVSKIALMKDYYKLVAFRYSPHYLKKYFWSTDSYLKKHKSKTTYGIPTFIGSDDVEFYNELIKTGINNQNYKKAFRFYHLQGAHLPYLMNENCEQIESGTTQIDQAKGTMKIVETYFKQLKDLGLYNNSTIVVLADHGCINYSQNPTLLIKKRNEKHEFKTSKAPISYVDLMPTFIEAINGKKSENSRSVYDIKEDENRERRYMHYKGSGGVVNGYLPDIYEYKVNGSAGAVESLSRTNVTFKPGKSVKGDMFQYKIGDTVSFAKNGNYKEFSEYGFAEEGEISAWSLENSSKLIFNLGTFNEGIRLNLKFFRFIDKNQKLIIYANNRIIYEDIPNQYEFSVPISPECIENGYLEIKFEYPNATTPQELGITKDGRKLAFDFESIVMEETLKFEGELNLKFNESQEINKFVYSEFRVLGDSKTTGAWTLGEFSEFVCEFDQGIESSSLKLELDLGDLLKANQKVKVFVNDQMLEEKVAIKGINSFIIPKAYIKNKFINIRLEYPDVTSPKALGINEDTAKLGLFVNGINLSSLNKIDDSNEAIIKFDNPDNFETLVNMGIGSSDGVAAWSIGKKSEFVFDLLSNSDSALQIELGLRAILQNEQRVKIYVNNQLVIEDIINDLKPVFTIPNKFLEEGLIKLRFEYPDAVSPKSIGMNQDERILACEYETISMKLID